MRYLLASVLILLLLATSCTKSTNPSPTVPTAIPGLNGTYTGTFQRQAGGSGQVSQVSLVFSASDWSGTSQTSKYPGLCKGTYQLNSNNRITFTNACIWTADFDWTLILSGDYEMNVTGNVVEFVKQTPTYRDVYRLSK